MPRKPPESVAARRTKPPPAAKPQIGKADVAMPEAPRPSSPAAARPTPPSPARPAPVVDDLSEIAARAYAKWLARGCPVGDDKRDWFEAQEEVRRERTG
jgi:hypothetical protein